MILGLQRALLVRDMAVDHSKAFEQLMTGGIVQEQSGKYGQQRYL